MKHLKIFAILFTAFFGSGLLALVALSYLDPIHKPHDLPPPNTYFVFEAVEQQPDLLEETAKYTREELEKCFQRDPFRMAR